MNRLLEFRHVKKVFRRSKFGNILLTGESSPNVIHAIDDVSFYMDEGECIGLVGRTGCGKSTLARIAVRLLAPDSGSILFKGESIQSMNNSQLRGFRSQVRMLFQDPSASLNPHMTVFNIVEEPVKLYTSMSKKERRKKVTALLEEVNIYTCEKKHPFELSGGEKRRVSLARGLAMNPKLIIADEVTSNLDSTIKKQVMNILFRRNRDNNMAILFISHDLRLVRQWCQRIEVMEKGRIVESFNSEKAKKVDVHHPFTKELLDAILEIK